MMSFSRMIGTLPSIRKVVRRSELVRTHSPIRMRSPGLSSTFNAMAVFRAMMCEGKLYAGSYPDFTLPQKQNGGAEAPPFRHVSDLTFLLEERQHRLVGLGGQRQRRGRQRLAGLQGKQVGAFLVRVGEDEVVGAGL